MRYKFFLVFVVFLGLTPVAFLNGATWYVDGTASGADNGTSWANAWTSPTNIMGILPGDTVYISGGETGLSQTYSLPGDNAWPVVGGTHGNRITYQIGQDAAHNGTAVFQG